MSEEIPMTPDTIRAAMQAHGLIRGQRPLSDSERWRLLHLSAMVQLALRADPSIDDLSAEQLYAGLSAVVPLSDSTVHSLPELLQYLAVIEQHGDLPPSKQLDGPGLLPPWDDGEPTVLSGAALDEYAEHLSAAIEASAAAQPWRVGLPREDVARKFLASAPKDYFKGAQPGVIPDLDQMDFSDVLDDIEE